MTWRLSMNVLVAMMFVIAPAWRAAAEPDDSFAGCAFDRPAIPHRAGGRVDTHRKRRVVPCSTNTGLRTGEPSIAVTNDGVVLFQPNLPTATGAVGLVRSSNKGATWDFIAPTTPVRTSGADMNIWVDRLTGGAFWTSELANR